MKKIITLIAAAAMLAVSCQKENTPVNGESNNPVKGKLTATIVQTKVSYTETTDLDLQPAWEVGDKIIGFDDSGNTYTLTVASVDAETATLSGTVPDGALHLIYKSGAKASDISSKTLAIDYTAQKGDKTMPAVMLADGTVEDGACDFAFTNAGAIIGISAVKGMASGTAINKISVFGENLSEAMVAFGGSALALTATTAASEAISTADLSGITVTDANGTLSSPVFIAVPAGAVIKNICVNEGYVYEPAAPRTVAGGEYLYIKDQLFSYRTYNCYVKYLDASKKEVADPKTIFDCPCGSTNSEIAIEIFGYQLQGASEITKTIWEDTTIEFYYQKDVETQWTYTVQYYDITGGCYLAENKVWYCENGETISESAIQIDGYRCLNPSITATITEDKQVFIFLYIPYAIG